MNLKPWILAARPKTLPAALVPVLLGSAYALFQGAFNLIPALLCALFALGIQVGTNFANDYYDFVQGADDASRVGPKRAVAQGWVRPETMRRGFILVFGISFLLGLGLIPYGGWGLVFLGMASVICGIAYTGGPYPLGYHGWGDVFVFVFFGWIATAFTYYVQAGTMDIWVWILGIIPGALSTNLLVVNNHRDADTDRKAGKRTLAVRMSRSFVEKEYALLLLLSFASIFILALALSAWALLSGLLFIPMGLHLIRALLHAQCREEYERLLAGTARLLLLSGLVLSLALALFPAGR